MTPQHKMPFIAHQTADYTVKTLQDDINMLYNRGFYIVQVLENRGGDGRIIIATKVKK